MSYDKLDYDNPDFTVFFNITSELFAHSTQRVWGQASLQWNIQEGFMERSALSSTRFPSSFFGKTTDNDFLLVRQNWCFTFFTFPKA